MPGVSGARLYVPRPRVSLADWCEWTDNDWNKVQNVVGRSFRLPSPTENVYTMAANAVLDLIKTYEVDPRRVGLLAFGTESSTDNAAGAVIVRGMVDRGLEQLGLPRLSRELEVPEFKHACLGGVYGLKSALRYVATDGKDRIAIMVAADVAEYERGSSGEQTQGAGAVAMLVEAEPKMFEVDLSGSGSASSYRGPDFRKPFARHFLPEYAPDTKRLSDFPVFSGKYSTYAYLDEVTQAVEAMLAKQRESAGKFYRRVKGIFFHRPYKMMPIQAMSFLYVRGLAHGENHPDELAQLCDLAEVDPKDLVAEAIDNRDIFAPIQEGREPENPFPATTAVASALRKQESFRTLLADKMRLGSEMMMDLGNLYSAALPAWLAAGFEEAVDGGGLAPHDPLVGIGYGSGDAAESMPLFVVPGWERAARRIGFRAALENEPLDLTREAYEALHDGDRSIDIGAEPKNAFVVSRVGDSYSPGFQDLGVEYYEYRS
ncbi:MAG: hydroxymethylglutaryl-CoA synthase [Myxococcota bacterium]